MNKKAGLFSSIFFVLFFFNSINSTAQTADNSFKISGGKFGTGTTFVFPSSMDELMNQAAYTGGFFNGSGDQRGTVHLLNVIEYGGKKITFEILINLYRGIGPGTFAFSSDKQPPPPGADCLIQREDVGDGQGFAISAEKGSVVVTGYSGKGGYIIGTFSGTFIHMTTPPEGSDEQPVIDQRYQVSGHFKGYYNPLAGY